MYKILTLLLIPLLLVLPISEANRFYFTSQNCQVGPKNLLYFCGCTQMQSQLDIHQDSSCCCIKSNHNDKGSIPLFLLPASKLIEFNCVPKFESSKLFDLAEKLKIIECYSTHYSAGISTAEELIFYFPPIYRQICSLRI